MKNNSEVRYGLCAQCGKLFKKRNNQAKYCGKRCRSIVQKRQVHEYYEKTKTLANFEDKPCSVCGKMFTPRNSKQKTCSSECARVALSQVQREYYQRKKASGIDMNRSRSEVKPLHRESKIDDINRAAREAGMTYGQYKALMYMSKGENGNV